MTGRTLSVMVAVVGSLIVAAPATATNVQYTLYTTEKRVHVAYIQHDRWVNRGVVEVKDQIRDGYVARWSNQGSSWAVNASAQNPDGVWIRCEVRRNGQVISQDDDWGTFAQVECG